MLKVSFATVLKACNFIKKILQHGYKGVFLRIFQKFKEQLFCKTTLLSGFKLCFIIRKKKFKEES